jgi:hypothetical protein
MCASSSSLEFAHDQEDAAACDKNKRKRNNVASCAERVRTPAGLLQGRAGFNRWMIVLSVHRTPNLAPTFIWITEAEKITAMSSATTATRISTMRNATI